MSRRGRGGPGMPAWAALAVGLAATLLLFRESLEQGRQRQEVRLHQTSARVEAILVSRVGAFEDTLRAAAGLFVSSDEVTEAEFRRYWEELEFPTRNPGVVALSHLVPAGDRILVHYRQGRPEPSEGPGADVGAVPALRDALSAARDSGAARVVLAGYTRESADGASFALVYPVFLGAAVPLSSEDRIRGLAGWVSIDVAINALMKDVVGAGESGLAISLKDGVEGNTTSLLYASPGLDAPPDARRLLRPLVLGGHPFLLVFAERPDFADGPSRRVPPAILIFGLLVSGLVFGITWTLSATRDRAEFLAAEMTESLRSSEKRFVDLFEQNLAGIFQASPDGRILACNEAFAHLFGYDSRQELLDRSALALYEDAGAHARFITALRERGTLIAYESRLRRKDGSFIWTLGHASLLPGPPEVVEGTIVDITAGKETEEALRQSRERYHSVIETSRDGLFFFDFATRQILESNPALQRMLGYTAEELAALTLYDVGPDDRGSIDENVHRLAKGQSLTLGDRKYRAKGGREVSVSVDAVVIKEHGRKIVCAIVHNLSPTRHLEEQLRQAQKMEAIGRLAGGVAHDFNNLLTAVLGYADLLLTSNPTEEVRSSADEIRKAGERAATLTRQLLAFSRKQVLQPRILDLNEILRETDGILRRLLGEDVKLEPERDPHLWRVKADPDQIQQVLLNLAVNSRDAMPDGGSLRIATRNVVLKAESLPEVPNVVEGDHVLLEIADTGHGMDSEVLSHAFEPFFTTKERGKGTGLGLSTVYGIVKQSGGYVHIESEVGKGTRFLIYLARAHGPADSPSNVSPRSLPRGGSETILLVEDEEAVRRLASLLLERSGYRLIVASSAEEAITLSREFTEEIHLLLTDIVLPGMNGRRLADVIGAERPGMKIIFASGYFDDRGILEPLSEFIPKPFNPDTLSRIVRRVLDRARRPPA